MAVDKDHSLAVRWKLAVTAVDQTAHGAHERLFHARARYEQICKVLGDSRRCVAVSNATLPKVLRIVRNGRRTDPGANQHERLEVQSSLERALLRSLARLQCSCFQVPVNAPDDFDLQAHARTDVNDLQRCVEGSVYQTPTCTRPRRGAGSGCTGGSVGLAEMSVSAR